MRLALMRALSRRDPQAIASLGQQALEIGSANDAPFLIGAAMLGHLGHGDREAARRVWTTYGATSYASMEPPVHVRLLELLSRSPGWLPVNCEERPCRLDRAPLQ